MKSIGRTDPTTPLEGRSWYAGAWRTPEEIETRRAYTRAHRKRIGKRRAKREQGERMRDRATPVPGRRWYAGRWRTEQEVVRVRERTRASNAARYVPRVRQTRLSDEERARRASAKRLKTAEDRRARVRARDAERAARAEPKRVPWEIRHAWRRGDANSIVRRKYPSPAALDAGARRGDFDGMG